VQPFSVTAGTVHSFLQLQSVAVGKSRGPEQTRREWGALGGLGFSVVHLFADSTSFTRASYHKAKQESRNHGSTTRLNGGASRYQDPCCVQRPIQYCTDDRCVRRPSHEVEATTAYGTAAQNHRILNEVSWLRPQEIPDWHPRRHNSVAFDPKSYPNLPASLSAPIAAFNGCHPRILAVRVVWEPEKTANLDPKRQVMRSTLEDNMLAGWRTVQAAGKIRPKPSSELARHCPEERPKKSCEAASFLRHPVIRPIVAGKSRSEPSILNSICRPITPGDRTKSRGSLHYWDGKTLITCVR
jgi:hypothetical protein